MFSHALPHLRHATSADMFCPPISWQSQARTKMSALLAVEVWKCQARPVQKDRQNVRISVIQPAVWKGMNASSRRNHVATNPNFLSRYTWYLEGFEQKWMNSNPLFLIHFWFSKTCPTVIFYWYLQCFFNVIISDLWKRSRRSRSAGMFMPSPIHGL